MKKIILILSIGFTSLGYSQVNCLIYPKGSNERKACEFSHKALEYRQGSQKSQQYFDKSIAASSKFAYSFGEKSIPYFKRGFILEGHELLDKAVELEPENYLCYRAIWYFQNRNYNLCIKDLERYYALPNAYIKELTPGGGRDMRTILGLAYAKVGQVKKGIAIVEKCIQSHTDDIEYFLFDYHILGVLYYKDGNYKKAIEAFKKELNITENLADTYYYMGLAYKKLFNFKQAKIQFEKAKLTFENPNYVRNGYVCFRVYPSDINEEIIDINLN